jgi:uncharacterized protein (UPF0333 family)
MRRGWPLALGIGLLVVAIAGIFLAVTKSNSKGSTAISSQSSTSDASSKSQPKHACLIFTLADAKQILGATAKGGQTSAGNNSSDDLMVSACSYTQDAGSNTPISSTKSASLLVRAPKTGAGITSNQNQFGPLKPADSQHVSGYGDNAYWDPQFGQLDILKHNTWYILSAGPLTPSARTLDQAKKLADLLINKM